MFGVVANYLRPFFGNKIVPELNAKDDVIMIAGWAYSDGRSRCS